MNGCERRDTGDEFSIGQECDGYSYSTNTGRSSGARASRGGTRKTVEGPGSGWDDGFWRGIARRNRLHRLQLVARFDRSEKHFDPAIRIAGHRTVRGAGDRK